MKPWSRFLMMLAAMALGCVLLVESSTASGGPGKSAGDPDGGSGYRGQGFRVAPTRGPQVEGFHWMGGRFLWSLRPLEQGALRFHRRRGHSQ